MIKKEYEHSNSDKWCTVISIIVMAIIIIVAAVFGCSHSNSARTGGHRMHHSEVANHIPTINKAYAHKGGIKSITFDAKKNHLIIYMDSQKHKPAHHYKDAILPITAQSEHAMHVGHMIGNSYNDHYIKTYFKD